MTHATCRLTAKYRDQLRNPTLDNRVWATFTLFICLHFLHRRLQYYQIISICIIIILSTYFVSYRVSLVSFLTHCSRLMSNNKDLLTYLVWNIVRPIDHLSSHTLICEVQLNHGWTRCGRVITARFGPSVQYFNRKKFSSCICNEASFRCGLTTNWTLTHKAVLTDRSSHHLISSFIL